jgi:acetyl esterase
MRRHLSALLFGVAVFGTAPVQAAPAADQLDADMREVLTAFQALNPRELDTLQPEAARKQPTLGDAARKVLQDKNRSTDPVPVAEIREIGIPAPSGAVPARVYKPDGDEPLPVIVYFHGGGWVIGNVDSYDSSARALADGAKAIVVSSHYRQAPEHPFPAAAEDAYAVTQWVMKNAQGLGGDPARVAVAGESAGGYLAAVSCVMARDRGGMMPVHQLLVYPVTGTSMDTESYREFAEAKPLNKRAMEWFFAQSMGKARGASSPYADLRAVDTKGLPPATIITAQVDPLASDGELYAEKLRKSGIAVEFREYAGVTHEFFGLAEVLDDARAAQRFAADRLEASFSAVEDGGKRHG